jgi:glucose-1-phosphatase
VQSCIFALNLTNKKVNYFFVIETKHFETIIFDLGGVFINLDFNRAIQNFSKLFEQDFSRFFSHAGQVDTFNSFEKGKISKSEFRNKLRTDFNKPNILDIDIDFAWNSLLVDWPAERMKLLINARKNYQIFLLSNNNAIHIEGCNSLAEKMGGKKLHYYFEKAYLSHEIGMRKPDLEIFEKVIQEQNLKIDKTLFIDDSVQHIEGAKKIGLHAYHLTNSETITDLFPHLV